MGVIVLARQIESVYGHACDEFDAEVIGRSETCTTCNLLVGGFVVEALVHYLAVFPSAG